MKNVKRIAAATMCGIMAVSMTACSGGSLSKKTEKFCKKEKLEQYERFSGLESDAYVIYDMDENESRLKKHFKNYKLDIDDYEVESMITFTYDDSIVGNCYSFANADDAEDFYEEMLEYYEDKEGINSSFHTFTAVEDEDNYAFIAVGGYRNGETNVTGLSGLYLDGSDVLRIDCFDSDKNDDVLEDVLEVFDLASPTEVKWSKKVEKLSNSKKKSKSSSSYNSDVEDVMAVVEYIDALG